MLKVSCYQLDSRRLDGINIWEKLDTYIEKPRSVLKKKLEGGGRREEQPVLKNNNSCICYRISLNDRELTPGPLQSYSSCF